MTSSDIDPEIAARLFEVKKNQLTMIQERGYNIDREKSILQLTLPQFLDAYVPFARKQNRSFRSVLTNVYENDNGKRILVYYADVPSSSTQLGVNELGDAIADMERYKLRDAVVITAKPLSPSSSKHLDGLVAYNIQIFLEEELAFNATRHFLVPKHIPLTLEEQRAFLNSKKQSEEGFTIDQMPVIPAHDPIARYYGLRGGRIVRIERENMYETMILKSVSYKVIKE
jgi:DNA-directed RNA polymerase I, II, and III subunit RPABC1